MAEGSSRRTLSLVADLAGAITAPVSVIAAVVAHADSPDIKKATDAPVPLLITLFAIGVVLTAIGAWRRYSSGQIFKRDRGRIASTYLYLGFFLITGSAVSTFVLR